MGLFEMRKRKKLIPPPIVNGQLKLNEKENKKWTN